MGRPAGALARKYEGMTAAERVLSNTEVRQESMLVDTPCWLWLGSTTRGYGQIKLPGLAHPVYVHRVVYEESVGPVPDGLELDHLCDVKRCCRPTHLEPVTHTENIRRYIERSRGRDRAAA